MGFFDSKIFQDVLALGIVSYFLLMFYSLFRKQSVKDSIARIREWYDNIGEEKNE